MDRSGLDNVGVSDRAAMWVFTKLHQESTKPLRKHGPTSHRLVAAATSFTSVQPRGKVIFKTARNLQGKEISREL
jgi:hypothetical protein